MIISISGIDGAGKSTQIIYIKHKLEKHNFKVLIKWARPGYTYFLEFLKKKFFKNFVNEAKEDSSNISNSNENKSRKVLKFLYLWASFLDILFFWLVYCRLKSLFGNVIILDRYSVDAEVDLIIKYPEYKKSLWLIRRLLKFLPKIDLSLYLKISWKTSMERSKKKKDPFKESPIKLKSKEKKYQNIINHYDYIMIDASKTEEEVKIEISNILDSLNLIR